MEIKFCFKCRKEIEEEYFFKNKNILDIYNFEKYIIENVENFSINNTTDFSDHDNEKIQSEQIRNKYHEIKNYIEIQKIQKMKKKIKNKK